VARLIGINAFCSSLRELLARSLIAGATIDTLLAMGSRAMINEKDVGELKVA
jgi:hypothetical protein